MAMKWYKPEDKEPVFGVKYVLLDDQYNWTAGYLDEIKHTVSGTLFKWVNDQSDEIYSNIILYLPIELPKKDFRI